MPPTRSGISDYSMELCSRLSEEVELDIYIDDYQPDVPSLERKVRFYPAGEFVWRNLQHPYLINIYQMGNNTCHGYLYPFVFQYPGILVLHDYILHHFRFKMLCESGRLADYFAEMKYCHPPKGFLLAKMVANYMGSRLIRFTFPLNKLPIEASLVTMVHNSYVKEMVLEENPTATVIEVSMGVPLVEPDPQLMKTLRERHRIGDNELILASFGMVTPEKGIFSILKVLKKIAAEFPQVRYLIVGERGEEFNIDLLCQKLGLSQRVTVTGFVTREEFFNYIAISHIGINLRYPTARETSATLLRIMAMGKPVLSSDLLHLNDLPEDIVMKIPVVDEEKALYKSLRQLIKKPQLREKLGSEGLRFVKEKHSLEGMSRDYLRCLKKGIELKKKISIDRNNFPLHLRNGEEVIKFSLKKVLAELRLSYDDLPQDMKAEVEKIFRM